VLRRAVPRALVDELAAAAGRIQRSVRRLPAPLRSRLVLERDLPPDRRDFVPAQAVGEAIFIIGDPVAFSTVFWRVLEQPGVVAALRQAIGAPALVAHFMNVTIKQARFGRAIGWHRDFPNRYACPASPRFARLMIPLDGMTGQGGATLALPGSHRAGGEAEPFAAGATSIPEGAVIRTIRCNPGDLVVIHPMLLHGGGMNRSAKPRRNLLLQAGEAGLPLLHRPSPEGVLGRRVAASPIRGPTPQSFVRRPLRIRGAR